MCLKTSNITELCGWRQELPPALAISFDFLYIDMIHRNFINKLSYMILLHARARFFLTNLPQLTQCSVFKD